MTDSTAVTSTSKLKSISIWIGSVIGLLVVLGIGFVFFRGASANLSSAPELDWRQLGELDYLTGKAPENLQKHNEKTVKIPGFMVALEDNQKNVTEFLLVPSPQACIHVPPPPPNQMVLVQMEEGASTQAAFGPIWVYGKLMIGPKKHLYGESSFVMKGYRIEAYQ